MKIVNAKILGQGFKFYEGSLCTKGAFISKDSGDDEIFDAKGNYVLPSLVDLHFHGADGCDFMDGTQESLHKIAAYEARCGIAYMCPASMTMGKETLLKAFANAAEFKPAWDEASLAGINMEGPFVSSRKAGAQNPQFVIAPDLNFFNEAYASSKGLIKILALAPETAGALDLIEAVKDKVIVSMAHTACTYDEARRALGAGASQLTHLYNAMPPLLHRTPGPIAACSDDPNCSAELICDGIHVHESMARAAWRLFGEDRIIMISDSMRATGLTDGIYDLGGLDVTVKGPCATLKDGTIAGSASNLYECLKTAVLKMGIPLNLAVKAASYNPAVRLGIADRCGTLETGKEASLFVCTPDLKLCKVLLRGRTL